MITDFSKLDTFMEKLSDTTASLKVVIFDEEDFEFAGEVHLRYPAFPSSYKQEMLIRRQLMTHNSFQHY